MFPSRKMKTLTIRRGDPIVYTEYKEECLVVDTCLKNEYPKLTTKYIGKFSADFAYKAEEDNLKELGLSEREIKDIIEGTYLFPLIIFSPGLTEKRERELKVIFNNSPF